MIENLPLLTFIGSIISALLIIFLLIRSFGKNDISGKELREEFRQNREEGRVAAKELREEVSSSLRDSSATLTNILEALANTQQINLESMARQLKELAESNQAAFEKVRETFDNRVKDLQEGNERKLGEMRKESSDGLKTINESLSKVLEGMGNSQKEQLASMTIQLRELAEANERVLEGIRTTFDSRIKELQEGNEKKLDEMRKTVDEKLHDTLEKRLGESFKLVGDRLEAVHKGLGEMQTLAGGVGDLKRVLTNVKARGTWAEVQLEALLEQFLTQEQFDKNVCVKEGSSERVEFAIRFPGSKDAPDSHVWLPIDSKFPQEDYIRLQDAAEKGDPISVQSAVDALSRRIRGEAKDINDKYISPPRTTDFAVMFLATEGLYSEVLRQPALVDELQRKYRVVVAGPTTIVAILNCLHMGFQTLVIEQRASEVWRVLAAVKDEFGKFGTVLDTVKRQLNSASNSLEKTGARSRAIEKSLRTVENLPQMETASALSLINTSTVNSNDDIDDGSDAFAS